MNYKFFITNLIKKHFKKIASIDITTKDIRIAVVDCGLRVPQVIMLHNEKMPALLENAAIADNNSALADFICSIFKREKIQADTVIFTLGAENSAVFMLDLPNMPENDLREAARWELENILNSNADNFCCTAVYLTKKENALSKVAAAAMPQRISAVFKTVAEKLDLPLGGVFLRSVAIEQTFAKTYTDFLLLDVINANEITVAAFNNGIPIAQKQMNNFDIADLKSIIENMCLQFSGVAFKQIIVNGNSLLTEEIEKDTNLPVIRNEIGYSIGFSENIKTDYLRQLNLFTAAIGAALCLENKQCNFLPFTESRFQFKRWQAYNVAAGILTAVFLIMWGWNLILFYNVQNDLQAVQRKIAANGEWQERYEEASVVNHKINNRLKMAETMRAKNINWQHVLTSVTESIPYGCWLEKIEENDSRQIIVSGYAPGIAKAVEFSETISKRNNIAAELSELKNVQAEGKNVTAFNLLLERK